MVCALALIIKLNLVVDAIKLKVIKDFEKFSKRLYSGYRDDYSVIMDEINFIENYEHLDNQQTIFEYLLNYEI